MERLGKLRDNKEKKMAQLRIRGVRSYAPDRDICFDLSSKVTLIYGQNGSGKSTVSGYFYDRQAALHL